MQGKVAIVGSADFVMPYSALGVDCFAIEEKAEQIVGAAQKIVDQKYALVIISENMAPAAQEVFGKFITKPVPCVLVMPFTTESKGFAIESLSRLLKIATGIDILKNT